MKFWQVALGASALTAPVLADPHIDIHGLVRDGQDARFIKGVPTLEMPLQLGAIQVRPLGFNHNDTVFAVAVFNAGTEPANIAVEDMHASVDNRAIRIWTGADLARQSKNRAMWAQLGIALVSGVAAGLAASQRDYYHSSLTTPYGRYSVSRSYPSLAGQLQANAIMANGSFGIAMVQQRLDMALANINENVVARTTVDPGMAYGAIVVVDKLDYSKTPLELHLSVDWNGERYPFAFLLTKAGQLAPAAYAPLLAENTRPVALDHRWVGAPAQPPLVGRGQTPPARQEATPEGAIYLASGVVKIPAKTKSGYCVKAPDDYVATGDLNYPVITGALPRCEDVREQPKGLWRRLQ
jgi:hypothetical protein